MRFAIALLFTLILGQAAYCQAADPFKEAQTQYDQLSTDQRIKLQILLTAAGYWNAVPNVTFSKRLFTAISQYQGDQGWAKSGALSASQLENLAEAAAPLLRLWNFREASHKGTAIWVPFGLGLTAERDKYGVSWKTDDRAVALNFQSFDISLADAYDVSLEMSTKANEQIHFKVLKGDFFVISASNPDKGVDSYTRYQRKGAGVIGFTLYWKASRSELHIERVATLISSSLWASSTGAVFTTPPSMATDVSAPAAIPDPKDSRSPPAEASSGSGFFIGSVGNVLTNSHVVDGCKDIKVSSEGAVHAGRVLAKDDANDLAILSTGFEPPKFATFRNSVRLGEGVAAFGFPLASVLASSGNFTLGNITALSGLGDDSRFAQISTPVQPGNSGGPLLDMSGNVVGVVSAKLNALKVMVATNGDIPQNVNFAVKSAVARNFLESNRVDVAEGRPGNDMSPADLAEHARVISVFIQCD